MAMYNARIAPFINVEFLVTARFGNYADGSPHRALDIATVYPGHQLYSVCNGIVIDKYYNAATYGNTLIMKDTNTGMGFLYGHLRDPAYVNIGDTVTIGQLVGFEGTTGQSTGIHLHFQMQYIIGSSWDYSTDLNRYENPAEFMDIPNTIGITAIWDGIIEPPVDPPLLPPPAWRQKIKVGDIVYLNYPTHILNNIYTYKDLSGLVMKETGLNTYIVVEWIEDKLILNTLSGSYFGAYHINDVTLA